jgi:hypothetical protein
VASKKTQRAIAAHDTRCLAELLAPHKISAGARDEIEHLIRWYRSGRSWHGQGARIEVPPEFPQMQKAVAALAELVNRVGVNRVVSIFIEAEMIEAELIDRSERPRLPDGSGVNREVHAPFCAPHIISNGHWLQGQLEKMLNDLNDFASRISATLKHGRHRSRKTDRPRHLVNMIAMVIERDKGKIKRSKNKGSLCELLTDIVALVDPEIGSGTIDEVLKARSVRRW